MSGGVDSAVAAALLHREGVPIVGAYMKNWINEENVIGNCPWEQDIEDARAAADAIGIPFRVVNLMKEYRARVVDYLLEGYRRGLTPNPDVMCNREIKFGVFLDYALREGYRGVATGHYARLEPAPDGRPRLLEGLDKNKDQSYFLALLQEHQLRYAQFPIGGLPKPRVRELAAEFGLPVAAKKDSQGICFIGEVKMSDFLEKFIDARPGPIVNQSGKVLGEHRGLHFYTIGQRRGVRVPSNTFGEAYVVLEKRADTNELVIGFDNPETPGLYASACEVEGITWTRDPLPGEAEILARVRYRAPKVACRYVPLPGPEPGRARLEFAEPVRALAIGQICALHLGEELVGGGVFGRVETV
jgi:tRNA-specific 2-thiouridylase